MIWRDLVRLYKYIKMCCFLVIYIYICFKFLRLKDIGNYINVKVLWLNLIFFNFEILVFLKMYGYRNFIIILVLGNYGYSVISA